MVRIGGTYETMEGLVGQRIIREIIETEGPMA